MSWCAASGAVAGLSLFWQTDVGLYTLAAGAAFYLGVALFLRVGVARPAAFVAAGLGTFAALCVLSFGPRVLSIAFVGAIVRAAPALCDWLRQQADELEAGVGLLVQPARSRPGGGVGRGHARHGRRALPRRAVLYGAATSLVGLAMLFKWVNRSLDVLWSLNGGLVAVVAVWWMWLGWRALAARLASGSRPWFGVARQFAAATVALVADLPGHSNGRRMGQRETPGGPVIAHRARGRTHRRFPRSDQRGAREFDPRSTLRPPTRPARDT